VFAGEELAAHVLIDRKLHAGRNRVVLVDAQRGGSDENLMAVALRQHRSGALELAGFFTGEFAEDAPVPAFVGTPGGWAIGIGGAVEEHVRTAVASGLCVSLIGCAHPGLVTAGRDAGNNAGQYAGSAVQSFESAAGMLRPGREHASNGGRFKSRADAGVLSMEAPDRQAFEIAAHRRESGEAGTGERLGLK